MDKTLSLPGYINLVCAKKVYLTPCQKEMHDPLTFLYNPFMKKQSLELLLYGSDTGHERNFVVDRPGPRNDWVILCFRTPFLIRTANGLETGQPGDCIVHDPKYPEWHTTVSSERAGFRNDWLHVAGPEMAELTKRFQIPLNQRIPTGFGSFLSEHLHVITDEDRRREAFWKEKIAIELEKILLRIGRAQENYRAGETLSLSERAHLETFRTVRSMLLDRFNEPWSINMLAALAQLSPNRFSVLYTKFFGISPIEELLQHRLKQSCTMLVYSGATLETIAERCGFTDAAYFSRVFKRRMGCTPGAYRKLSGSSRFR
jgi:AraC-like DNA-binding protein